jgi:hypothetical protein
MSRGVLASRSNRLLGIGIATCIACAACRKNPGPDLQVLGESTRWRVGDALPATSPWFDGTTVTLVGARGETLGIQVFHREPGSVQLDLSKASVRAFDVEAYVVKRPSTEMYGGSHGEGAYPDGLVATREPTSNPAYFEIAIASDAAPGTSVGELVVAGRKIPVTLAVRPVTIAPRLDVWAYEDPRELDFPTWRTPSSSSVEAPSAEERSCIAMFRSYGVLLSPDMNVSAFPARKQLLAGFEHIPALIPTDPKAVAAAVHDWIAATADSGQVPFVIPIDEPHTPEDRKRVRELADAVRAAGGGPGKLQFAVTDEPRPEYGDAIDLYISWNAAHLAGDRHPRWTYNGKPPRAGSMVLDAETPGTRTWGWIAWRWQIPVWYAWEALYWHDRHNRKGGPLPGRVLDPAVDAVSFDDGDDHGNLDGVLALYDHGCKPTLRLAAIRRGFQDRALLELAGKCAFEPTATLAAELVPRALGDASDSGPPAWPTDEAAWETARRKLLDLAACK